MTELQGTKKSSLAPWLIGCGLVFVLGIVGLGGVGYYWVTSSMMWDPDDVNALATDIVPGARAPEGLAPTWGMDMLGVRMAMFAPPESDGNEDDIRGTVILVASGERGTGSAIKNSMRENASGGAGEDVGDSEDLGEEVISVGGVDVSFEKSRGTQDGVVVLFFVGELPVKGKRQPVIMITGPEDNFDRKAMDAFLAGIEPFAKAEEKTVDPDEKSEGDTKPDPDKKPDK